MDRKRGRDIVSRWKGNPIITLDDLSFQCSDICNAGAVKVAGEYILLLTIQNLEGFYSIYTARSTDGYCFKVSDQPLLAPSGGEPFAAYEELGVLDPRIVLLEETYYISYNALGLQGYRLGLASSKDFRTVQRIDLASEPDTKAGVLFPRKIKGKYARLERPSNGGSIWVTYSDDLEYWGWSEVVMTPRSGFWDNNRIGAATPPMETDQGWLEIYHGVKMTSAGPVYRVGAVLLDLDDPSLVISRCNIPLLSPREDYERIGDVGNVVFACGALVEPDGEVKLYYGAADTYLCVATARLQDIIRCTSNERGEAF